MVLALTLVLVLAPSGMISKKGVPEFCPSTVEVVVVVGPLLFFPFGRLAWPHAVGPEKGSGGAP